MVSFQGLLKVGKLLIMYSVVFVKKSNIIESGIYFLIFRSETSPPGHAMMHGDYSRTRDSPISEDPDYAEDFEQDAERSNERGIFWQIYSLRNNVVFQ